MCFLFCFVFSFIFIIISWYIKEVLLVRSYMMNLYASIVIDLILEATAWTTTSRLLELAALGARVRPRTNERSSIIKSPSTNEKKNYKYECKWVYLALLCLVPGAGPKWRHASLELRGPDNSTQFSPFGERRASWSKVKIWPPAFRMRCLACSVTCKATTCK